MIIDDVHRVAFVHVPKCAGTSVRRQLQDLDCSETPFYGRREHDRLGPIDYAHLPLSYLESDFPEVFTKLAEYESFALARDPHKRFISAIFERLALFKGLTGSTATAADAIREAGEVMDWLESRENFCDARFIHFARQCDYVRLNGRNIVRNIYALEDLVDFGAHIQSLTGAPFDADRRENINFASTGHLLSVLHRAKPLYVRFTTWDQRQQVLKLFNKLKLQSSDTLYDEIASNSFIEAFIRDYYDNDYSLLAAAREHASLRRSTSTSSALATDKRTSANGETRVRLAD